MRDVLANIPVYMMWDDHDIRDGWGSSPADSPTMVARYPRGAPIFELCRGYFEDCRDAYWHFQACHNPRRAMPRLDPPLPNYVGCSARAGNARAMPFAFRCGRLVVLVLDSRGERDVFREALPILGTRAMAVHRCKVFANLASGCRSAGGGDTDAARVDRPGGPP